MTDALASRALFYVGGAALGVLGLAPFVLVVRLALRSTRRQGRLAWLSPPQWPGCFITGAGWVAVLFCTEWLGGGHLRPPLGALTAACLSPGDMVVGAPATALGVDVLGNWAWLEAATLLMDVALYGVAVRGVCWLVRATDAADRGAGTPKGVRQSPHR